MSPQNALIAIMNNTFTRVAESEHPVRDKEVASVMLDRLRNLQKQTRARWQKQRRWVHVLSPRYSSLSCWRECVLRLTVHSPSTVHRPCTVDVPCA